MATIAAQLAAQQAQQVAVAAIRAQGGDPTYGLNKPFSPFREATIRWLDALYKVLRVWALIAFRYLYVLFIPNFILFIILLLAVTPLLAALYAAYEPLLYLREHQVELMTQLTSSSDTLDAALDTSRHAINTVLHTLSPGFKLWNLVIDWAFFLSIKIYTYFGCIVGNDCAAFEAMFAWIGQMIPWVTSLFLFAWQFIGGLFVSLASVGYSLDGPLTNISTLYMAGANGSLLLAPGVVYLTSGLDASSPLHQGLSESQTHRLMIARRLAPAWADTLERERRAFRQQQLQGSSRRWTTPAPTPPGGGGGGGGGIRVARNPYPCPCPEPVTSGYFQAPPGCGVVCTAINDIVSTFFHPDVFQFFLDILQALLAFGLGAIKDALNFFLTVILPFFEWLLGVAGGTLAKMIAFFQDVRLLW